MKILKGFVMRNFVTKKFENPTLRLIANLSFGAVFALMLGSVIAATSIHAAKAGEVLDAVKKRGILNCGVNTGLAGFWYPRRPRRLARD